MLLKIVTLAAFFSSPTKSRRAVLYFAEKLIYCQTRVAKKSRNLTSSILVYLWSKSKIGHNKGGFVLRVLFWSIFYVIKYMSQGKLDFTNNSDALIFWGLVEYFCSNIIFRLRRVKFCLFIYWPYNIRLSDFPEPGFCFDWQHSRSLWQSIGNPSKTASLRREKERNSKSQGMQTRVSMAHTPNWWIFSKENTKNNCRRGVKLSDFYEKSIALVREVD